MTTDPGASFRRQRALEFGRAWWPGVRLQAPDGSALGAFERLRLGLALLFGALGFLVYVSLARGHFVHWAPGVTPRLALVWLLWGLGGAWPVLVALAGGFAWPERSYRPLTKRAQPLLELLPLSRHSLLLAKLQGRGAAWLLHSLLALGLLAGTRVLMARWALVSVLPPLLDPWLTASACLFVAVFVVSNQAALAHRRRQAEESLNVWALAFLGGLVAVLAAAYAGLLVVRPPLPLIDPAGAVRRGRGAALHTPGPAAYRRGRRLPRRA